MGCWDIFCFACGNTCHSLSKYYLEDIGELYKEYVNNKLKISPYYKKLFEQISLDSNFFTKLKALNKNTQWLNKCTFLTVDDRIIHGCKEKSCNIEFIDSKGNKYYHDINTNIITNFEDKVNRGVFIHTDCWKYIKSVYKINLKYSDIPAIPAIISNKVKRQYKINSKIDYGEIEKYWEQDFNFIQVILDSNDYMCESPLKDDKNLARIKKILSQLKINNDVKRTGPSVSATFYPESTFKYGIDKGIWEKKSGKWVKLKEPINKISVESKEISDKKIEKLKKIVCIGEPSTKPIFIIKINKIKNIYKIDLIGIENLLK